MQGEKILVLSDLTLRELDLAPDFISDPIHAVPRKFVEYITVSEEAKSLAEKYINEGALGNRSLIDAQHIALATLNRVDVLVSWNFKNIVHFIKVRQFNAVNLKFGYQTLEIRSPREVV